MKTYLGLAHGFHDAAMAVIENDSIIYAGHSERYSRIKNDKNISCHMPLWHWKCNLTTAFYERPFLKNTRRLFAGQKWKSSPKYDHYIPHHWSHAAGGYYTRPWAAEPVCVVIDAIGEWDTCSIWYKKKKVWSKKYPYSLGLFYSAITQYIGLKPNEDEYITMGMAAFGKHVFDLDYLLKYNLHKGIKEYVVGTNEDIAAATQACIEKEIITIMTRARKYSDHLCYSGGVALNCVANSKIHGMFKNVWIMPNPGDSGSALGAAAAVNGNMLEWKGPYLGHDIQRTIDPKQVVEH